MDNVFDQILLEHGFTVLVPMIFMSVFLMLGGTFWFFRPQRSNKDRIFEFTGSDQRQTRDPVAERIAERLGQLAKPANIEEHQLLKNKLAQAGYRSSHATDIFNGVRVAFTIGMPVLALPLALTKDFLLMGTLLIVAAAIGYYAPGIYLSNSTAKRKTDLVKPLPDAMDFLVSTVEAGLGLDAAFRRVADELQGTSPELAREFQMINHEIAAGVPRTEALKHLGDRTGLEEIHSLVNMLAQAERFGTSIAHSLRVFSDITRQKRMARAEEEAAKISPKLTVVMILFLMPCLMVILLGPAGINIKNNFIGM